VVLGKKIKLILKDLRKERIFGEIHDEPHLPGKGQGGKMVRL
jgi:hypothetical protein